MIQNVALQQGASAGAIPDRCLSIMLFSLQALLLSPLNSTTIEAQSSLLSFDFSLSAVVPTVSLSLYSPLALHLVVALAPAVSFEAISVVVIRGVIPAASLPLVLGIRLWWPVNSFPLGSRALSVTGLSCQLELSVGSEEVGSLICVVCLSFCIV